MVGIYTKAIVAAFVAALMAYITANDGPGVSATEWVGIVVTFIVAAGAVWAVPNLPANVAKYGKMITAGLVAAAGAIGTGLIDGGLNQNEVITAVVALLINSGLVSIAPNAAASDPVNPDTKQIVAIPEDVKNVIALPGTSAVTTSDSGVVTVDQAA